MIILSKEEALDMLAGKEQEIMEVMDSLIDKHKTKKQYETILWDLSEEIERCKQRLNTLTGVAKMVYEENRIDPLRLKLKQTQNEMSHKFKVFKQVGMTLDEAKAIPILTILDAYNIRHEQTYGNRVRFKLRDEKTPSAVAYLDQNSWHDYGDQSGGSVLDLVMNLDKCDFKTALKTLASYV